jgi:predicted peptidase
MPLILFLHGAGESGTDDERPTTVGIGPAIDAHPERFPALVVFPQASRGYGWRGFNLAAAVAALDDVEERYSVDRGRVYVTGISMGGYGTWLAALQQPERFAAAVPVCGGLDRTSSALSFPQAAQRLAPLPQWVFHGDADDIIPVQTSRAMVRALRAAGGADVRYTEYAGVKHNSWDRAYAEPELMPWLLRQRRR